MSKLKQKIRVTDLDGNVTDYESIKDLTDESGYTRAGIWYALKRGYFGSGKYKKYKVEKT